jgi:hypothetical protein
LDFDLALDFDLRLNCDLQLNVNLNLPVVSFATPKVEETATVAPHFHSDSVSDSIPDSDSNSNSNPALEAPQPSA